MARVAPGLVAIAGGKYTTYRVMAEDAVDAAAEDIPARVSRRSPRRCRWSGADGYFAMVNQTQRLAEKHGCIRTGSSTARPVRLADRRACWRSPPGDPELLQPITDAPDYLQVEAVYAAEAEGALHLEDVLARRTRISIEYAHRGVNCASRSRS